MMHILRGDPLPYLQALLSGLCSSLVCAAVVVTVGAMFLIGLVGGAVTYTPVWARFLFIAARVRITSLPAMVGAWMLDHLVGPYPEPKQQQPAMKTAEIVPFPTRLAKTGRRDPPP